MDLKELAMRNVCVSLESGLLVFKLFGLWGYVHLCKFRVVAFVFGRMFRIGGSV